MRIDRFQIDRYGGLEEIDSGTKPLGNLVVIHGRNESGKSTLLHFITSMLFGFDPDRGERHPYLPWSRESSSPTRLEGGLALRTRSGRALYLSRTLNSHAEGWIIDREGVETVHNHPLPSLARLGRELFVSVYAPSADRTRQVEHETWDRFQERLVTGLGTRDLRSLREVLEGLELEARDATGAPEDPLSMTVEEIERALEQARRTDAEEERLKARQALLEERHTQLEELRREARQRERRGRRLLPLLQREQRIQELRESIADPAQLALLPARPGEALERLRQESNSHERRLHALEQRRDRLVEVEQAYGARERHVLAANSLAQKAIRAGHSYAGLRHWHQQCNACWEGSERELQTQQTDLFRESLSDCQTARCRALPLPPTQELLQEAQSAREAAEKAQRWHETRTQQLPTIPPFRWGWATAEAASVAAIASAWLLASPLLAVGGGVLLAVSAVVLGWTSMQRHEIRRERTTQQAEVARWQAEESRQRQEYARLKQQIEHNLRDLPLRSSWLANPTTQLGNRLEALKQAWTRRDEDQARAATALAELQCCFDRVTDTARGLGLVAVDPSRALEALQETEADARDRRSRARQAAEEIAFLVPDIERYSQLTTVTQGQLRTLESHLLEIEGAIDDRAVARVQKQLNTLQLARSLEQEVARDPRFAALRRELESARASREAWLTSAAGVDGLTQELDQREQELSTLKAELQECHIRLASLQGRRQAHDLELRLEQIREDHEDVLRTRDRLRLLATLLRRARLQFQQEHLPDILERASSFLRQVTAQHYTEIYHAENGVGPTLRLRGPGSPEALPQDAPLSRSARDQAWFCLRLAIAEHLDSGTDPLPVFMDEPFLHWDRERRERAIHVLRDVSRERQVFLFTVEPELLGFRTSSRLRSDQQRPTPTPPESREPYSVPKGDNVLFAVEDELRSALKRWEEECREGDLAVARHRPDLLGEALRLVDEVKDDEDLLDELRREALPYAAADGSHYARELLQGMEREILNRLRIS